MGEVPALYRRRHGVHGYRERRFSAAARQWDAQLPGTLGQPMRRYREVLSLQRAVPYTLATSRLAR